MTQRISDAAWDGRWADAVPAAAGVLAGRDARTRQDRVDVWNRFFLGADCLPVRYARAVCDRADNPAERGRFVEDLESLLDPQAVRFAAEQAFPHGGRLLTGLVRALQAAAGGGGRAEAVGAYDEAFGPGSGEPIVGSVIRELSGGGGPAPRRATTPVLIAVGGEDARVAALTVELRPGPPADRLLPDPLRLGLVAPDERFAASLAAAWSFVTDPDRWPCPAGVQACWWLDNLRDLPWVGGPSAGAAAALALRAAIQGVRLDPRVAVSATVDPAGALGDVEHAAGKWAAARAAGCDRVLFAEATAGRVADRGGAPRVVAVRTFAEVWELATGRVQAVEAYLRAEQADVRARLRFLPPGAGPDVLDRLAVPARVLTAVLPPETDAEALARERDRARGRDDPSLPPMAAERLGERYRDRVRGFDRLFAAWRAAGFGPVEGVFPDQNRRGRAVVLLGDPGYGKSWLVGRLSLAGVRDHLAGAAGGWLPLRVTCQELGRRLAAGRNLPAAVAGAVAARLRHHGPAGADHLARDLRAAVEAAFAAGRVLLLVDGWDERADAHDAGLREAINGWGGPVLVASRVVGHSPALVPDAPRWQLMPLDAEQGVPALVRGWFGPDEQAGGTLLAGLRRRPQLVNLVRVPLIGALVCRMWQGGDRPELPAGRTDLLGRGLGRLVSEACRPAGAHPSPVLGRVPDGILDALLAALARLAYRTFTGERWVIGRDDLRRLVRGSRAVRELGSSLDLGRALTNRFGLFTDAGGGRLEVLHQSFAEYLCARAVRDRFFPEGRPRRWDPDGFRGWLRGHGGPRFLDPRWHEVWCHLAALLPDPAPVLDELLAAHDGPGDDLFGTALRLAGHCLAAAAHAGPGADPPDSPAGPAVLAAVADRWAGRVRRVGRRADPLVEADSDSLVAVARAGYHDALTPALCDPDPVVRFAAARLLGQVGPPAVPILRRLIGPEPDADPGVRQEAVGALARIGPGAADAVPELFARLRSELATPVGEAAAWALGRIGPAAVRLLPDALRGRDPAGRRAALKALERAGPGALPVVAELVAALGDADPVVQRLAESALVGLGPTAVPALRAALVDAPGDVRVVIERLLGFATTSLPAAPARRVSRPEPAPAVLGGTPGEAGPATAGLAAQLCLRGDNEAMRALERIGPAALPGLRTLRDHVNPAVRIRVLTTVARIVGPTAPEVREAVRPSREPEARVRLAAVGLLADGGLAAVPALRTALSDPDPWVRDRVRLELYDLCRSGPRVAIGPDGSRRELPTGPLADPVRPAGER